jgi:ABC-type multidrug transport system fused ATPase/permease subunit
VRVDGSSFSRLYSLLKGEVKPRVPALLAVFLFASLTAFAQKAPILLMEPLLKRVLFPSEGAADAREPAAGVFGWVLEAKYRATDALFGTPGTPVDAPRSIALILGLIALFAVIVAASEFLFNWTSRRVALSMVIGMRLRLARHLVGLSMRYHGERRFGDLLSRISSDVGTTLSAVNVVLKDVTQLPFLVVGSLVAAFITAPLPTLSVLVVMPLIAIPIGILGKRVRKRSKKSLTSLGASVEVLSRCSPRCSRASAP